MGVKISLEFEKCTGDVTEKYIIRFKLVYDSDINRV